MGGSGRQQRSAYATLDESNARSQSKRRQTHESASPALEGPSKRRRVTRACDQCRQGREKCDGSLPCHTCTGADRQCSYKGASKRRGVQPGYIRALEVLLAWILTNIDGTAIQIQDLLAREPVTDELGLLSKDSSIAEDMSHMWIQSQVHKDLESMLSGKQSGTSESHHPEPGAVEPPAGQSIPTNAFHDLEDVEMVSMHSPGLPELTSAPQPRMMPKVLSQTYFLDSQAQGQDPLETTPVNQDYSVLSNIMEPPPMANLDFFSGQDPHFVYSSPIGLDAFLEELAAAESAEVPNLQPQFMQNLGFGPDLDPSQFISETGEWMFPQ